MEWLNLALWDLREEPNDELGFLCKNVHCKAYYKLTVEEVIALPQFNERTQLFEVQEQMKCTICGCPVRLEWSQAHLLEPFRGGQP